MTKATVTSKGQVTIPKEIREYLKLDEQQWQQATEVVEVKKPLWREKAAIPRVARR